MHHPSSIVHRTILIRTILVLLSTSRARQAGLPRIASASLLLLLITTVMLLPSCHRSGSFNVPPLSTPVVICDLAYSTSQLQLIPLVEMDPLAPIIPAETPCQPIEYQVNPPLPAGLSLDPATGVISGTPTVNDTSTVHLLTSVYPEGLENFELTIVILPFFPAFSYSPAEVVIPEGAQTILSPTLLDGSGAIDFWSVETAGAPPLSAIVDSVTGELALFGNGDFSATVTGSNEVGESTFTITVTTFALPQLAAPLLFLDDGDGILGIGDHIQVETTTTVIAPVNGNDALALSSGSSLGSGSTTIATTAGFTQVTIGPGAVLHGRGAAAAVGATTAAPQDQLPTYGTPSGWLTSTNGPPLETTELDLFPGMRSRSINDLPATDIISFQIDAQPTPEALALIDGQVHLLSQTTAGNWIDDLLGGSQLTSIAAGDIDRDGDIDAVAAGSNGLVLLLNEQGTLTFSTIDSIAASRIQMRDIDRNGTQDLVVARSSGILALLSGAGNGDFVTTQTIAGDGSQGIEIVDLDRDGQLDIATAEPALYRGTPTGWESWAGAPLPSTPCTAITSIDIDRANGWQAIVWVTEIGHLHRIDHASGNWQTDLTEGLIDGASFILATDLDRDGGSDLLLSTSSGIRLHPSRGALPLPGALVESPAAQLLSLSNARSTTSIDLDGDGDLDLLAAGPAGIFEGLNCLETILGSLSLNEEHDEDAEDSHISALASNDIDRDGWLDLIVTGQSIYYEPGVTWILYGGASGSTIPSEDDSQLLIEGVDIRDAEIFDIDRDGDLDIMLGAHDGIDQLLIQQAPRQWQVIEFSGGFASDKTSRLEVGDLNGDGIDDVVQACRGLNRIWLGDGTGSFSEVSQPFPTDITYSIELADVDQDGDLDLICGNSTGRHNRLWFNDGAANFTNSNQVLGVMEVRSIVSGDLDKDGDLDLILGQNGSGPVGFADALWLNDGQGTFSPGPIPNPTAYTTMQQALGDLDLDGQLDLATATATGLQLQWGAGVDFTSPVLLDNHFHGTVILVDIDGDGDLDLFSGTSEEDVDVWLSR